MPGRLQGVRIGIACAVIVPAAAAGAAPRTLEANDDRSLAACNSKLGAGDTCVVAPGTYRTPIQPFRDGKPDERVTYTCPSAPAHPCLIDTDGPDSLVLGGPSREHGASYVTVDGFTFQDGPVRASGRGSKGIVLDRIATRDPDNQRPCASVTTEGGESTVISRFSLHQPARSSSAKGPAAGCDVISLGTNVGKGIESGTTLKDGLIRGGWNGLQIGRCDHCVLDGVKITGAKNHTLSVGSAGGRTTDLTVRNSVVMASTGFREPMPFVAWQVVGLTLLNNAFITGWAIPAPGDASIRHEMTVRGPITIRNNIFYSDRTSRLAVANNGTFNGRNPVAWDVDYNAYVGAGSLGGALWTDSRDCSLGPGGKAAGPGCPEKSSAPTQKGGISTEWRDAGFDAHSIVFENTDYATRGRDSDFPVRGPLWGATGPFSGAMVECQLPGGAFAADPRWGSGFRPGDHVEYGFDGVIRTVRAVKPGLACAGADNRVGVTLDPPVKWRVNEWVLSWGPVAVSAPDLSFVPQKGSPVIDAGDDAHCGHEIRGGRCDIGPVESGADAPTVPPPVPPAEPPAEAEPAPEIAPPATGEPEVGPAPAAAVVAAAPAPDASGQPAAGTQGEEQTQDSQAPAGEAAVQESVAPGGSAAGGPAPQAAPAAPAAPGTAALTPDSAPIPLRPVISGIGLGSTGAELRKALGEPEEGGPPPRQDGEGSRQGGEGSRQGGETPREQQGRHPKQGQGEQGPPRGDASTRTVRYPGVQFELQRREGDKEFRVLRMRVTSPDHELAPGLRIGITREEAIALLGPAHQAPSEEGGREQLRWMLEPKALLRLTLEGDKVVEIGVAEPRAGGRPTPRGNGPDAPADRSGERGESQPPQRPR